MIYNVGDRVELKIGNVWCSGTVTGVHPESKTHPYSVELDNTPVEDMIMC